MRIIAGVVKGFLLKAPKGLDVRPTSDRVKETVFNILSSQIIGAAVLDLFAGTGNLGLESLSRGATSATFFDTAKQSLAVIKENIAHTNFNDRCEVRKTDALLGLDFFRKSHRKFDLIFCDPPYNRGLIGKVLTNLDNLDNILSPDGILIVEHSCHERLPDCLGYLQLRRTEKFGETLISFVTRKLITE
jgi:16S rRNA (guanine(966)-N(2))-methyltransferase RsmD